MDDGGLFLAKMWRSISPLVKDSIIVLILMFFWTVVEMVEKTARHGAAVWESRRFLKASTDLLDRGDSNDLITLAVKRKHSHVAAVFSAGLREFRRAREVVSMERSVEVAEREARVAANRIHEVLRKGVSALGSIATTAPLVGLFGTVIGIFDSFSGSSGSRASVLALVAMRISLALVTTALGLLVAVLAVWCFNWLNERLAMMDAEMTIARLELGKYLEGQRRAGKL
jgi:biopolymer transport protein ExbB/TolQ